MIPSAMLAILERVIWAPEHYGTGPMYAPARCRCCGRPRYVNERLSSERDGRDHVQDCPVLDLLAALREGS